MSARNPYTGTPYGSWDDVEKDIKDHPECKAKILAIARRIQEVLSHQQISELCGIVGAANAQEFMKILDGLSDDQLRDYVDRVKRRKKVLQNYLQTQGYATVAAGVS